MRRTRRVPRPGRRCPVGPAKGSGRGPRAAPRRHTRDPHRPRLARSFTAWAARQGVERSEEHTSELQSRLHLVCPLLLGKKKKKGHSTSPSLFTRDTPPYALLSPTP